MKLNMDLLCDALSHHKLTASITESSALYLRGPRLWGGNLSAIKPDYVYVTTAECLMSHDNFGALKNVICVGCNQYLLHKYENSANIIAILENIYLIDLFSEISEIFETFSEHDRDFLTAIATEQPIGEILQKAARFFDNPIILLDESMMRIAIVSELDGRRLDPQNWRSLLEDGYIEPEVLKLIDQRTKRPNFSPSKQAQFDSIHPMRYSSITVQIWDQEKRIGTLIIPEEFRKMNRGFLALADYVVEQITNKIVQGAPRRQRDCVALEQFFTHLFSGTRVDREFLKFHLQQLQWQEKERYTIIVAELNPYEKSGEFYRYGAKGIKRLLGNCFYLIFESYQVYIVNVSRSPLTNETLVQLRDVLDNRDIHAGISMELADLEYVASQYVLAKEALRIGKECEPSEHLHNYCDYVEAHMIDMRCRPAEMSAICLPAVRKLYEYDLKNSTELVNTLYVYLRNERSPTKAAKKLFIHRNSLMYRIERINNILNCDYEEPGLRAHLLISCQILRYYYLKLFD